ncbi:MAG: hypothetical protein QME60_03205 [Verrucomicrobiota bacterium]|nr:hypothetical protein [Verrucomicrobiota bacterium]
MNRWLSFLKRVFGRVVGFNRNLTTVLYRGLRIWEGDVLPGSESGRRGAATHHHRGELHCCADRSVGDMVSRRAGALVEPPYPVGHAPSVEEVLVFQRIILTKMGRSAES